VTTVHKGIVEAEGTIMVKRSLIVVALLLSVVASNFVTAPPAAASVTNCGPYYAAVVNLDGQLVVRSCIRHTAGHYYSWGEYYCRDQSVIQPCNVGATQHLWYNATLMRSDNVSGLGLDWSPGQGIFGLSGSPAGCTTALITTSISNIRVRFAPGKLWSSNTRPQSGAIFGSQSC
jgi:hypothetical protein